MIWGLMDTKRVFRTHRRSGRVLGLRVWVREVLWVKKSVVGRRVRSLGLDLAVLSCRERRQRRPILSAGYFSIKAVPAEATAAGLLLLLLFVMVK